MKFKFYNFGIAFLFSTMVVAETSRTVYYAMETILGEPINPTGLGVDIIVYNPSTVSQTITHQGYVKYNVSSTPSTRACPPTTTTLNANETIHLVCTATASLVGLLDSPVQVYGTLTASGNGGFVIANGSEWSVLKTTGTGSSNQLYSAPFNINGGRPF